MNTPERKDDSTKGFSDLFVVIAILVTWPIMVGPIQLANRLSDNGHGWIAVLLGMGSLFVWLGCVFGSAAWMYRKNRYLDHAPRQSQRIEQAQATLEALQHGRSTGEFYVYLRSFAAEGLECSWYELIESSSSGMWATTLDDELAFALDGIGNVLCLGNDAEKERLGVPRIRTSDDEWREFVRGLMDQCAGIILFPWPTRGTVEETVYIYSRTDLIGKTVLFMPPSRLSFLMPQFWQATRDELAKHEVELPEYQEDGAIFSASGYILPFMGTIQSRKALQVALLALMGRSTPQDSS